MYWAEKKGIVPKGTAKRWERHTKKKRLPERKKKMKKSSPLWRYTGKKRPVKCLNL